MLRGAMSSSSPSRRLPAALLVVALLGIVWVLAVACNFCDSGQSPLVLGSNVYWTYVDSIAACPAGDSLLIGDTQHRHPSKLRLEVWYDDVNCNPKAGVPPESLWVTWSTASGNAAINDQGTAGTKIFADDSTDACGHTRFTIPSLSGCGKLAVTLRISGRAIGIKTVVVRTVDVNATGRVDNNDLFQATCDVRYSGNLQSQYQTELAHEVPAHWHRNALFGTLVRRTSFCPTCTPHTFNTPGDDFAWSTNGKMLAVDIFDINSNCAVNLIPSDPAVGNVPIPFSMPPDSCTNCPPATSSHDYSPQWSPLGTSIYWNRGDYYMMYKGIAGQNLDTTTYTVPISSLTTLTEMSLSPDGKTLLFAGRSGLEFLHIYTVSATGGTPVPVTSSSTTDQHFPQWSPDGATILFQQDQGPGERLYQVPAAGGTPTAVDASEAGANPFYSSDAGVVVFARGWNPLVTATIDQNTSGAGSVANYEAFTNQFFAEQRISPDGTRLGLRAVPPGHTGELAQIWAARRNMSAPPRVTSFGGQSLADTTAAVPVAVIQGLTYTGTVVASDVENDALTYAASYLQQGMTFDPVTRTFSWTPPSGTVGGTFNVKFYVTTPSGGTDSFIGQFTVHQPTSPQMAQAGMASRWSVTRGVLHDSFEISGHFGPLGARMEVFDVRGRRVARVVSSSTTAIRWDLRATDGTPVRSGVYFYRAYAGGDVRGGKLVVAR